MISGSVVITFTLASGGLVRINGSDLDADELVTVLGMALTAAEGFLRPKPLPAPAPKRRPPDIPLHQRCRCGRFSQLVGSGDFPLIDDEGAVHGADLCLRPPTGPPAAEGDGGGSISKSETAPAVESTPTPERAPAGRFLSDHAEVARIAREARQNGDTAARAVAEFYDIKLDAARMRIRQARRRGHDVGDPAPPPAAAAPRTPDGRFLSTDDPPPAPRPVTPDEWLGRVDEDDAGSATADEAPKPETPQATVLVIEDPHEDEPAVDDPPSSTHTPTCMCIRCVTRQHREAKAAAEAKAVADEAARIEWGMNGESPPRPSVNLHVPTTEP